MVVNKNMLVDKGIELFQKYGYKNVTVNMICDEFHITKGSFYHHFKSKDELLTEWFYQLVEGGTFNKKGNYENSYEELRDIYMNWGKFLESVDPDLLTESINVSIAHNESSKFNFLMADQFHSSVDYLIPLVQKVQNEGYISNKHSPLQMINIASFAITGLIMNQTFENKKNSFLEDFTAIFETVYEKK